MSLFIHINIRTFTHTRTLYDVGRDNGVQYVTILADLSCYVYINYSLHIYASCEGSWHHIPTASVKSDHGNSVLVFSGTYIIPYTHSVSILFTFLEVRDKREKVRVGVKRIRV